LAIGHAYIFEVSLPLARREEFRKKQESAENLFLKAIKEMEENAILDKRWRNVVNTATKFVRERCGTEEANVLLTEAQTASLKISEANALLTEVKDKGHRLDVKEYELAVLFDAHGLPLLSVVARRTEEAVKQRRELKASKSLDRTPTALDRTRDGSDIAGMWSVAQFTEDKLEDLKQANETLDGEAVEDYTRHWAALAWGEVPVSTYREVAEADEMTSQGYQIRRKVGLKPAEEDAGFFSNFWFGRKSAKPQPRATKVSEIVEEGDGGGIGEVLYNFFGIGDSHEDRGAIARKTLRDGLNKAKKVLRPEEGRKSDQRGKKRQEVRVPRLLDGKLGVKLKGGTLVVGFDHPEAEHFGWQLNDEIVEVNSNEVTDRDSFAREYMKAKKTLPIVFTVFRNVGGPPVTGFGIGPKKKTILNPNRASNSVPPNARLDTRQSNQFAINVTDVSAMDGSRNPGTPRDPASSAIGSEGARRRTTDVKVVPPRMSGSLTVAPELVPTINISASGDGRSRMSTPATTPRTSLGLPMASQEQNPSGTNLSGITAEPRPLGPRTSEAMRQSVQLDPSLVGDLQLKPLDKE